MRFVLVLVIIFAVVGPALMLALATAAEDSLQRATESTARPVPRADPSDR